MSREAMKHTPGPWKTIKTFGGVTHVMTQDDKSIALLRGYKHPYSANARLITAAPDLLSALDDLARYADTCELFLRETHPGKADMLRKRVTAAIDAMAKATGGEV